MAVDRQTLNVLDKRRMVMLAPLKVANQEESRGALAPPIEKWVQTKTGFLLPPYPAWSLNIFPRRRLGCPKGNEPSIPRPF